MYNQKYIKSLLIIFFISFISTSFANNIIPENKHYNEKNFGFTRLIVFVLDNLGNRQEGAKVTIYDNKIDYISQKNSPFETITTDKKGRAVFKNVKPKVYYLHITKGDLNNNGNGVKTQKLDKNKINKLNIVID